MDDTQHDVVPAEATAAESSPEEQTTTTEAVAESTAPVEEKAQTVPYERFREVNEKAKQVEALQQKLADLEAKLTSQAPVNPQAEAIKEQLKAMGFAPVDEIRQELQKELSQREQDAQVKQEIDQLTTRYNGQDGRPKFEKESVIKFALDRGIGNLEYAYKLMHEKELLDWHVKQALSKTRGVQTEGSDGSGSSQVGTTNADLVEAYKSGDKAALRTYLKRLM